MSDNRSSDLLSLFNDIESHSPTEKPTALRPPMGYIGGKSKLADRIVKLLPNRSRYIEVFGGSAAVLLAKPKCKLEVYNDRYGGVVAFYRCLRDQRKVEALIQRLELTVHAREEWHWCRDTWECDWLDDVERAARWYYMMRYSFAQKGRAFGRAIGPTGGLAGRIIGSLREFPAIHQRLQNVQIENRDWYECMIEYDHPDTVFYLDPPYLEVYASTYNAPFTKDDHTRLLNLIPTIKGFVALSGYRCELYDSRGWDSIHSWDVAVSTTGLGYEGRDNVERGKREEVLYIKESGP